MYEVVEEHKGNSEIIAHVQITNPLLILNKRRGSYRKVGVLYCSNSNKMADSALDFSFQRNLVRLVG